MIIDPATAPTSTGERGLHSLHLSVAGGITQFGACLETLPPGGWSSRRHRHSAEDEFVYILDGVATVIDDDGPHLLHPGDAAAWRHGDPNAHHITNTGPSPLRILTVGSRAAGDNCTYPDDGRRQVNGPARWQIIATDGTTLREGDLPAGLLTLPAPWGRPFDGTPKPNLISKGSVPGESDPGTPLFDTLGVCIAHPLSDAGGLTRFGAFTETLLPGARSGHRHWHASEDEFLSTLDGTGTLHETDGAHDLPPGTCVCRPAGVPNGHQLENRTTAPVTSFVAGSRLPEDTVTYPDIDLHYTRRNGLRTQSHKDGTPYPGWPKENNR